MSRVTIVDNEFVTSWCYPEKKIIRHEIHKFTHGEVFRDFLTKSTDVFIEIGCVKWLSDDRNAQIVHFEDRKWGEVNWLPRIIAAGWQYWAILLPTKVSGQMTEKRLIEQFSQLGVIAKVFTDPDEGMIWLECREPI
jgi:hypothetical protein